ncbi:hypothetical protein [Ciceribacter sp. L1K22]|uniref:hypothetical protein n=1 Tax=Ciceribacter sp. L1K22 TaxID=2820275 RepID=UPI001ABEAF8E|nr:hypothetical protein [Ciceribacter sp. L1K22]MBO3762502.1 hypothetical protein [Ciceribacter sp. L1K22]
MEIYPLRYTGLPLQRQPEKNAKEELFSYTERAELQGLRFTEHLEQVKIQSNVLTHRELKQIAQSGFESGLIELETYRQLAAQLPLEAVDARGQVVDLSTVTDDTPFDFAEYYRNQMAIARTLGDEESYDVLKAALTFLEG